MNIFYLHEDPKQAAEWTVDKHTVKMILETAQLLSTAHRLLDGEQYIGKTATGRNVKRWKLNDDRETNIYSATHINHPSSIWSRNSSDNYDWLYNYFRFVIDEYTHRYGKTHKTESLLPYLQSKPYNIAIGPMTEMPCAMGDEYIVSDDPVENYRNYYKHGKKHLHKWSKREIPYWIME
jgi:hypothetical protein